jgi:hypothetical protein
MIFLPFESAKLAFLGKKQKSMCDNFLERVLMNVSKAVDMINKCNYHGQKFLLAQICNLCHYFFCYLLLQCRFLIFSNNARITNPRERCGGGRCQLFGYSIIQLFIIAKAQSF